MHNHSAGRSNGAAALAHIERHKHAGGDFATQEAGRVSVALVGNPNVGKSLFFNYLSGMYVDVSNYPGTTIEFTTGRYQDFDIVDTPGVYGISSFSDEERVTREVVLQADAILNIVDAAHLERDLFLTLHLIDMGKKISVFLNCMDEVEKLGLQIDAQRLSDLLGVPIFTTTATTRAGFEQVEAAIAKACRGGQDSALHHQLHALLSSTGSEAEALLIMEGDEAVAQRHGLAAENGREAIYIDRRNLVNSIID